LIEQLAPSASGLCDRGEALGGLFALRSLPGGGNSISIELRRPAGWATSPPRRRTGWGSTRVVVADDGVLVQG
jgi:hypothetical protein